MYRYRMDSRHPMGDEWVPQLYTQDETDGRAEAEGFMLRHPEYGCRLVRLFGDGHYAELIERVPVSPYSFQGL